MTKKIGPPPGGWSEAEWVKAWDAVATSIFYQTVEKVFRENHGGIINRPYFPLVIQDALVLGDRRFGFTYDGIAYWVVVEVIGLYGPRLDLDPVELHRAPALGSITGRRELDIDDAMIAAVKSSLEFSFRPRRVSVH